VTLALASVVHAMTDDIVTRLREELLIIERHGTESLNDLDHAHLLVAAVDEIEYLRNEIAEHHGEYQKLWNKHNAVMRDKKHPLTNDYIGDI
jgi:uncharacterized protein YifE (UPF0438 family)